MCIPSQITCKHILSAVFDRILFILAGNYDIHKSLHEFGRIRPRTVELAVLERRKEIPLTYNGENYVITFSQLFLIGSFSYLQVMRTCIKAWMSLNLGQIPPLTMELAALERLKNRRHHFFSVAIDPILFKLAGNEDMHNILDEFEFRPDLTTDDGVSCP